MRFSRAVLTCCISVFGIVAPASAGPITIEQGISYLQTAPGLSISFGAPYSSFVSFMGNPVGPGLADTIIQRTEDATADRGATASPIKMQVLDFSLKSSAPVNIGGSFFDVFVMLDPNPGFLANDNGLLIISLNAAGNGGVFDIANMIVTVDVTAVPVGGGPVAFSERDEFTFISPALSSFPDWSTTAPLGALIVPGPDDGTTADQNANQHSGLEPDEVDFYPGSFPLDSARSRDYSLDPATPTPVPEPSAATIFIVGGLGLLGCRLCKCQR